MRVLENRPSKQKDPDISGAQKKQSMVERFFVEICGTMGYMLCLHLGQDLVDKLADLSDRRQELDFLNQKDNLFKGVEQNPEFKATLEKLQITINDLDQSLRESAEDVFGKYSLAGKERPNHMIFNTLYDHALPGSEATGSLSGKANLVTVKNRLKDKLIEGRNELAKSPQLDEALSKIVNEVRPLKDFVMKNNRLAVLGIAAGVASSAIVGGPLTQWMNDRVIAPSAKKVFTRKKPGALLQNAVAQPVDIEPKSFSVVSAAPEWPMLPNHGGMGPPVYLPNPKTQGPSSGFMMPVFPSFVHQSSQFLSKPGGGF
jgi:hypothetical protein